MVKILCFRCRGMVLSLIREVCMLGGMAKDKKLNGISISIENTGK